MRSRTVQTIAAAAALTVLTPAALQRVAGQTPRPAAAQAASQTRFTAPRTPWGHPDLQGTYSNDDETGTPMARPAQFAGRTLESITPAELAVDVKQRNERVQRRAWPAPSSPAACDRRRT